MADYSIETFHYRIKVTEGFWEAVATPPDMSPSVCWEWTGSKNKQGYGYKGKSLAHRVAYEVTRNRPIRPGYVIMHLCDNPSCCNPYHLKEGTQKENLRDASLKGRMPGNRKYQFSEKELNKLARYEASLHQAVARHGCSQKYLEEKVAERRNILGIPHRKRRDVAPLNSSELQFLRLHYLTYSYEELGCRLGRTRRQIERLVKKHKLPLKRKSPPPSALKIFFTSRTTLTIKRLLNLQTTSAEQDR